MHTIVEKKIKVRVGKIYAEDSAKTAVKFFSNVTLSKEGDASVIYDTHTYTILSNETSVGVPVMCANITGDGISRWKAGYFRSVSDDGRKFNVIDSTLKDKQYDLVLPLDRQYIGTTMLPDDKRSYPIC